MVVNEDQLARSVNKVNPVQLVLPEPEVDLDDLER